MAGVSENGPKWNYARGWIYHRPPICLENLELPVHNMFIYVQEIVALKKGLYILKYGPRGKPKLCSLRLLWYVFTEKENENTIHLNIYDIFYYVVVV